MLLELIMNQLEKIKLIKTVRDRIFFFKEDNFYKIYNENVYWFCKKLQPIKINKTSNKKKGLVFRYGSIPITTMVFLKEEYPLAFLDIKTHKYGFSIEGTIDVKEYVAWRDTYQEKT